MRTQEIKDERPNLDANDPPHEHAAFERERARLVRDHLGQLALLYGDEVVGAFATYDEARREGDRRFGLVRLVIQPITEQDEPEFLPYIDINHPSAEPPVSLQGRQWLHATSCQPGLLTSRIGIKTR